MSRPKKGQPGHDEAVGKWRATMEAKYGGKEGFSSAMQKIGAKGGHLSRKGGFGANPELARIAGRKGGRASKRTPGTYDALWEQHYDEIMSLLVQDTPYSEISRRVGIPEGSIKYRLRK